MKTSCDDALFIVNRGHVKPQKHVALGIALKSLTGSKKIIQLLNRFGHCLNYHCLEELETATAERIQERDEACPEGTEKNVAMGLASISMSWCKHSQVLIHFMTQWAFFIIMCLK